ncbi:MULTISPECIES: hypothetical protein [Chryseobacterium]|uniref:Uncharacterized protein n=1 Tax=Candidatus Chryseobacterium massiliense TaxID=204089 RepID=A0A3D9BH29_9FLAO|nr:MULTISPECIES: hypothetical protein [Chryseobacterium]REC52840.1 hypothetical protein DRF68_01395 [Candidatus Chryseobacterium massiliae]
MKKLKLLPLSLFFIGIKTLSQVGNVGINTSSPQATLDIRGKNDTGSLGNSIPGAVSANDGILVPRVNSLATSGSTNGQLVYLIADAGTFTKGFHYWNGSVWTKLGATNIYENNGIIGSGRTVGITDNVNFDTNTFVINGTNNNIGIGTNAPNTNSILDMSSSDKGILIPRVNLTSSTQDLNGDGDNNVANQPEGLLVFNSGSTLEKGYYFWNGTEWRNIKNSSSVAPGISSINCLSTVLSPKTYVAGSPYIGSMSVAYTGGNGASYGSGTPISSTGVTGLTATLRAGTLAVGDGMLIYDITGTPSGSSPSTASFDIPGIFGASGCTAVVGAGNTFSIGETQSFAATVNATSFFTNSPTNARKKATNATGSIINVSEQVSYDFQTSTVQSKYIVINGLRLDFMETPFSAGSIAPVLFNTKSTSVTYSISALSTNDQFVAGANSVLPADTYSYRVDGNDSFSVQSGAGGNNEYVNAMLTFSTGEWYQITYFATRDATNIYFYFTAQRLN